MKLRFFKSALIVLNAIVLISAQPGMMSPEARERIESQRIAFITQKVHLTPDQATKFWPVYNEYRDGLKDMREDFERPDLENISDEDAAKLIDKHLQMEQKRLDMKRNLTSRLKGVISSRQTLQLFAAEMQFNRELLKKAQEFRKQ